MTCTPLRNNWSPYTEISQRSLSFLAGSCFGNRPDQCRTNSVSDGNLDPCFKACRRPLPFVFLMPLREDRSPTMSSSASGLFPDRRIFYALSIELILSAARWKNAPAWFPQVVQSFQNLRSGMNRGGIVVSIPFLPLDTQSSAHSGLCTPPASFYLVPPSRTPGRARLPPWKP